MRTPQNLLFTASLVIVLFLGAGCDRKDRSLSQVEPVIDRGGMMSDDQIILENPEENSDRLKKSQPKVKAKVLSQKKERQQEQQQEQSSEQTSTESESQFDSVQESERTAREGQDQAQHAFQSCETAKNAHPRWNRADLEYSATGIDCFGDEPTGRTIGVSINQESRAPASSQNSMDQEKGTGVCLRDPHAHPLWNRADIEYSVTGVDCHGDEAGSLYYF